ncbi:hypothetical protein I5535_18660 [Rhodobacteraceae bacterium F11138]|nr:hypothetical protein [Rhodobacteraceae bacterium F11138]
MARTIQELTVITSLNPFSRAPLQLRCFHAWKALGVRILSANIDAEADQLLDMGLKPADILRLAPEQTGQEIHGKPVPRISATLHGLRQAADGGPAALVNSDLFPAMRHAGGLTYWLDHMPAVALTREDCACPETHGFADRRPYRGGLDAFVFSNRALDRAVQQVDTFSCQDRMCFGIVGWDHVMGALILSPQIGGGLADGGMLLHEVHPTTYSSLEEFTHYLPDMRHLAGIHDTDPVSAAIAFTSVINRECEHNTAHSRRVCTMQFTPQQPARQPDAAAHALSARLTRLSPTLPWTCPAASVALLAMRDRTEGRCDLTRARALFETNPDPYQRFVQRLLAILYCLELQTAQPDCPAVSETYPPDNQHSEAIRGLRDLHAKNPRLLRFEIALIFGSELVEYAIFNPRIFNYLMHSCETDEERHLLSEILTHAQARLRGRLRFPTESSSAPHVERPSDAA